MSGGSMDYVHYRIGEAASEVQRELANVELKRNRGIYLDQPNKYYVDKYPDIDYIKDDSGKSLTDAVISRLRDALIALRRAEIYARRVEWLTSGDDGYESFCIRLDDELSECEKHEGVV